MLRPVAAWSSAGLLLVALCGTVTAEASHEGAFERGAGLSVDTDTGYTKAQTYSAALRYLRVDLSYEVTEKDPAAAYLLFRFVPIGRKTPTNGAIEIIEKRDGVRVTVRLPEMPRYVEQMMSDGLESKLHDEYGEPPPHDDGPPPPRHRQHDDFDNPDGG